MKRLSLILVAMMLVLGNALIAQTATLKATVSGLPAKTTKVVIGLLQDGKLRSTDTIALDKHNTFSYSPKAQLPALYVLSVVRPKSSYIHIMLMPNEKITMQMAFDTMHNMMNITQVKGSKNMEEYQKFSQLINANMLKVREWESEYADNSVSDMRKQEIAQLYEQLTIEQGSQVRKLIQANKRNLMSAFLITYFNEDFNTHADLYEELRDVLIELYPSNELVKQLDNKVKTSLKDGSLAPEIAMCNANGDTLRLSALRGKVVLIDFWASWCRPCRMENPNVVKLYNKYNSKGFDIYSVSLDNNKKAWLQAIENDKLSWPNHVSDLNGWNSTGGAAYGVTSIPCTVLIDRQGRIIAKNLRGAELENKLRMIFGE